MQPARRFERPSRKRIETAIDALANDPRPHGCTKLTGANAYRIRIGDYRVVYTIDDKVSIVDVTNVGHRGSIYQEV